MFTVKTFYIKIFRIICTLIIQNIGNNNNYQTIVGNS